jgi:hypothetical protein
VSRACYLAHMYIWLLGASIASSSAQCLLGTTGSAARGEKLKNLGSGSSCSSRAENWRSRVLPHGPEGGLGGEQ